MELEMTKIARIALIANPLLQTRISCALGDHFSLAWLIGLAHWLGTALQQGILRSD
jgi:hypothetical protein